MAQNPKESSAEDQKQYNPYDGPHSFVLVRRGSGQLRFGPNDLVFILICRQVDPSSKILSSDGRASVRSVRTILTDFSPISDTAQKP